MAITPEERQRVAELRRLNQLPDDGTRGWLEALRRDAEGPDLRAIDAAIAGADKVVFGHAGADEYDARRAVRRPTGSPAAAPPSPDFGKGGDAEYERRHPNSASKSDDASAFWSAFAQEERNAK